MTWAAVRVSPGTGRAVGRLLAWLVIHHPAVGIPVTAAALIGGLLAAWRLR